MACAVDPLRYLLPQQTTVVNGSFGTDSLGVIAGLVQPGHPQSKRVGGSRQLVAGLEPATVDRSEVDRCPTRGPLPDLARRRLANGWVNAVQHNSSQVLPPRGVAVQQLQQSHHVGHRGGLRGRASGGEPARPPAPPRYRTTERRGRAGGGGYSVRAEAGKQELPGPGRCHVGTVPCRGCCPPGELHYLPCPITGGPFWPLRRGGRSACRSA